MPAAPIDNTALDAAMAEHGITSNYELAKRMGVAASTVYRLRSGEYGLGPTALTGLMRALPGVNPATLIKH